jgi:hypothetical protein
MALTVEKYSANATGYLHRISELHRHRLIRKPKKSSGSPHFETSHSTA